MFDELLKAGGEMISSQSWNFHVWKFLSTIFQEL